MNTSKIASALFYLIGSCIFVSMGTIVAINIYADSKLFEPKDMFSVLQDKNESKNKNDNDNDNDNSIDDMQNIETLKYKRNITDKISDKIVNTELKPKQKVLTSQSITVELINEGGSDIQLSRIKTTLEAKGYKVVIAQRSENANQFLSSETKILDRNEKGYGTKLKNDMKLGRVYKFLKKDYKYDLTLIIGIDYNP